MVRGDEFRTAIIKPFATKAGNALVGLEERLRGASAETADYFWLDHAELAEQKGRAGGNFVIFREAIFGRAAFDDIADVNVGTPEAHRLDHLREEFASAAHEWFALNVFVATGALSDEDELRFRIADAEDDLRASFVQFAAHTIWADVGADALEAVVFDALFEEGRRCDRWNETGGGPGRCDRSG